MQRSMVLAATMLVLGGSAHADPGYYVISPYDREGVLSAELRYWSVKPHDDGATNWPELGISYGVNSRWTTLLLASYIGTHADATVPSSISWQNEVLLTQGQWPLDIALHLSAIHLQGARPGDGIEFGPVLQTNAGRMQINANLLFERDRKRGAWGAAMMKYQWQLRWHGWRWLQPGMQGFGELGPWNDTLALDAQSHRAGPALFATLPPGGEHALQWQLAWLLGKTYGERGAMFSTRLLLPF
jgi:hypothetical protein